MADVIENLLGIAPESPLARLRALRPEATTHMQGSYDALFVNDSVTTVIRAERFAIALRVAAHHGENRTIAHYSHALRSAPDGEGLVDIAGRPGSPCERVRLAAMLDHADLLVLRPGAAVSSDIRALEAAGLDAPEIVTVSQIIAFVSFHIRVLIGLALLRGDVPGSSGPNVGPRDATDAGFTLAQVGWSPWIEPFAAAEASDAQRAVLPGRRINSPYFRLLALDHPVLGERTATDMGIFYGQEGLPRAERELSATVASRVNGCIYCASVHSRQAAQISKRNDDVQRLLDVGIAAELDDRWRAIVDLAAALTRTPSEASQSHIARLRSLGLSDFEILDVIQSAAFFNWANRLMLTLGEPVPPAG